MAGAAASLMGFSQMGLAALAGLWVGHSFSGSVLPMAALIAGGMAGSLLAWLLWVRGKRLPWPEPARARGLRRRCGQAPSS